MNIIFYKLLGVYFLIVSAPVILTIVRVYYTNKFKQQHKDKLKEQRKMMAQTKRLLKRVD